MARLVTSGFELGSTLPTPAGSTTPDGVSAAGGMALAASPVRTGSWAFKADATTSTVNTATWTFPAVTLGNDVFFRSYIYVATGSAPNGGSAIMGVGSSAASALFSLSIEANQTLTLWAFIGGIWVQQGSASAAITLDAWNRVELRGRAATGSIDQIEARLEGATFASTSGLTVSDSQTTVAAAGFTGIGGGGGGLTSGIVYFDDVAVNDSSGAAQNSWPGDGKVVLLKPITDSAVGTGWTLGTGTAIAGGTGSTAVKNIPPVGVADLTAGSDTKQIRNASSNASVSYDANLTTYTTAGIAAADTVNVLVPIVATAAPVTTSAKAGTFGVSTNPAITNISLGAGGTSGAFWSGVAAGTYPTGWKWSFGTTTYAPSVTLGSSPVARITQVTASTRIAIVCAMGMYVDYTPAVVAARQTPNVNMAPQRA